MIYLLSLLSPLFAVQISDEVREARTPEYAIESIILNRWSPRAMTGAPMSNEELFPLFEAARWAPSSFNSQPWRILYAKRDTPEWSLFFDLLVDFNQEWCKNASALILILSRDTFEHNGAPYKTHSFDTGAAWMAMALEGSARGLVVHGMGGFDSQKAREDLEIPDGYTIEAMAAIGKRGPKTLLPEPMQGMESPSTRKPIQEIAHMGKW